MRLLALLLVVASLAAGCASGDEDDSVPGDIDLARIVGVLPTPAGFDQSNDAHPADVAAVQEALAGMAREESARAFESRGFVDGAIRTWSGPRGATLTAVVSRWPDHLTASAIGGGAVNVPLDRDVPGASPWNPDELRGGRGVRIDAPGEPARLLAVAVGDVSLFVRASGPAGDAPVLRTMELLRRQLAGSRS
jgi:hypothetical protein